MQETPKSIISAAAAEMGRRGAKARAERLTPEERSEHARKMNRKRWGTRPKKKVLDAKE